MCHHALDAFNFGLVGNASVPDPCLAIAGKKKVLPREVRAYMSAFPLDSQRSRQMYVQSWASEWPSLIEVVNKTLDVRQLLIQAPLPFQIDVREDHAADLTGISQQIYPSDFNLSSGFWTFITLSGVLTTVTDIAAFAIIIMMVWPTELEFFWFITFTNAACPKAYIYGVL